MTRKIIIDISNNMDLIVARKKGREISQSLQFGNLNQVRINTAISELARNILLYAGNGHIILEPVLDPRAGLKIIAKDQGCGIEDIQKVMQDGYSTSGGYGLGLPGVRRLMDEFKLKSEVGVGTEITVVKWH
jgi:serine/threonine-protein kinase RsbT